MEPDQKLSLERRRERLQEALASQMVPGMRVEAQTDLSASIVFGNGLRRVFTVADDGTVRHQDFDPMAASVHDQAKARTGCGTWLLVGGVAAVMFVVIVGTALRGPFGSDGRLARDQVQYRLRTSPLALELTLTEGPETLFGAELEVNDRWTCTLGTIARGEAVQVPRSACVTEAGLGLPSAVTISKTQLRSANGVVKTQR